MSTVSLYTFEDQSGSEQTFTTFNACEAKETAKENGWKCFDNEYEYSDREVAWDFTEDPCDQFESEQPWRLHLHRDRPFFPVRKSRMFNANDFDRTDPETGKETEDGTLFVIEVSMLMNYSHRDDESPTRIPIGQYPTTFLLFNCPAEGMHRSFYFVKADKSGEDVAGWRYEECAGPQRYPNKRNTCEPFTVLIIND